MKNYNHGSNFDAIHLQFTIYKRSVSFTLILNTHIEPVSIYFVLVLIVHSFLALKIHVSPSTKEVLDSFGTFELELRGEVEMKVGFRLMTPYKSLNCL